MSNSTDNVKHPGPLSGLKVIDLTQYILGPVCTQILGDMGADVIKVETPEGDLNRDIGPQRYPHMSALFLGMNRNKRSVVLDLHNQQAKAAGANAMVTAGPAFSEAAIPVSENNPAPIIAPIPKATRFTLLNDRFNVPSPVSFDSNINCSIDFLWNIRIGLVNKIM